jgi:hypothetical protein
LLSAPGLSSARTAAITIQQIAANIRQAQNA